MDLPDSARSFLLISTSFFLMLGIGNVLYAHRENEKIIYLTATTCFLISLTTVLMFIEQFLLTILLFASSVLLAVVAWPKTTKVSDRIYAKTLHEIDLSTPLRIRDFLTMKGWAIMVLRGEYRKAILLIWFPFVTIGGGLSLLVSSVGIVSMTKAVIYTIICSRFFTIFYYRQIKRTLSLLDGT